MQMKNPVVKGALEILHVNHTLWLAQFEQALMDAAQVSLFLRMSSTPILACGKGRLGKGPD